MNYQVVHLKLGFTPEGWSWLEDGGPHEEQLKKQGRRCGRLTRGHQISNWRLSHAEGPYVIQAQGAQPGKGAEGFNSISRNAEGRGQRNVVKLDGFRAQQPCVLFLASHSLAKGPQASSLAPLCLSFSAVSGDTNNFPTALLWRIKWEEMSLAQCLAYGSR